MEATTNGCRHCNRTIKLGEVCIRISSWWLLCLQCYNGAHQARVIEIQEAGERIKVLDFTALSKSLT